MWSRSKNNCRNTLTFYREMRPQALNDEASEDSYHKNLYEDVLNILVNQHYSPSISLILASLDRKTRKRVVDHYSPDFYGWIYEARVSALKGVRPRIMRAYEAQFDNQSRCSRLLYANQERMINSRDYYYTQARLVFVASIVTFSVLGGLFLLTSEFDKTESEERDRNKLTFYKCGIVVAAMVVLAALVLGSLKFAMRNNYSRREINKFLSSMNKLSLPDNLPQNQGEWEAAFNKLMGAEERVDKVIAKLESSREVEAQLELNEGSSLLQNRSSF